MLPRCFNSWVEFTLQRRLHKQRKHKAEVYNQWVTVFLCCNSFPNWVELIGLLSLWNMIGLFTVLSDSASTHGYFTPGGDSQRSTKRRCFLSGWYASCRSKLYCWLRVQLCIRHWQITHCDQAILHEERCHMQRAWSHWRERTKQQIYEEEKEKASDCLYLHRLLHKTMTQWKDNSTEIQERWIKLTATEVITICKYTRAVSFQCCWLTDLCFCLHFRRNREQQACHQGDLRCMKWAVEKWKKVLFVVLVLSRLHMICSFTVRHQCFCFLDGCVPETLLSSFTYSNLFNITTAFYASPLKAHLRPF